MLYNIWGFKIVDTLKVFLTFPLSFNILIFKHYLTLSALFTLYLYTVWIY